MLFMLYYQCVLQFAEWEFLAEDIEELVKTGKSCHFVKLGALLQAYCIKINCVW